MTRATALTTIAAAALACMGCHNGFSDVRETMPRDGVAVLYPTDISSAKRAVRDVAHTAGFLVDEPERGCTAFTNTAGAIGDLGETNQAAYTLGLACFVEADNGTRITVHLRRRNILQFSRAKSEQEFHSALAKRLTRTTASTD